MEHLDIWLCH